MLNRSRILSILIVSLTSASGFAQNVCSTINECQQLKVQVDTRIQEIQATQDFSDIARNADGSIRRMNQYEAVRYCSGQGMRLPSARELVQLFIRHGAAGISETPRRGYEIVSVGIENGKADIFYYSKSGYKRPKGDLGNNIFWSSSVDSYNPNFGYDFYGRDGSSVYGIRGGDKDAVVCVANR